MSEYFYRWPLFYYSIESIPQVQSYMTTPVLRFFRFMTFLGYAYMGAGTFFLFYVFSSRERAFYLLFVVCF